MSHRPFNSEFRQDSRAQPVFSNMMYVMIYLSQHDDLYNK